MEAVTSAQMSMEKISKRVGSFKELIQRVSDNSGFQNEKLSQVKATIDQLNQFGEQNSKMSSEVAVIATELSHAADYVTKTVSTFKLPPVEIMHEVHKRMSVCARRTAAVIGNILEQGFANEWLKESELFEVEYEPLSGTDPKKFRTGFDRFCDQNLPAVQEARGAVKAEPGCDICNSG